MLFFLLQIHQDTLKTGYSNNARLEFYSDLWFWLFLFEFFIIFFMFLRAKSLNKFSKNKTAINEALGLAREKQINMNDLMESINNASNLYKELSRKYHPDRFVNSDKQVIAEELFKEIELNKRDYKELCDIKNRAIVLIGD